jgi:hypothetical protein
MLKSNTGTGRASHQLDGDFVAGYDKNGSVIEKFTWDVKGTPESKTRWFIWGFLPLDYARYTWSVYCGTNSLIEEYLTMTDSYITFEDEHIKLRIPRQLCSKHADTAYSFKGFLKRGQKDSRFGFILILDPPPVSQKGMERAILDAPSHIAWMGGKWDIIRRGKCSFGDGGIEVLGASTVPETTGTIMLYRWNILYRLGGHHVYIDLSGGGDLEAFEKMGTTIIESIVVK